MLEKINEHYSFTAPATIYDEEALTTLELAARTAAKVNECVQAFNNMEEDVKKDINNQHLLLNDIDLLVSNFIGKYGNIEDAGAYTMFTEIVHKIVDEGKFAEIYDVYADYIKGLLAVESKRIDTLIGGATPADDAEVIDLRIDCEGNEWGSAGSAVRNMTRTLLDRLEDFTKPNTITIAPVLENEGAIWQKDGELRAGYGHFKQYAVQEGEKYLVSAYYGFQIPDVVFSDGNAKSDGTDGLNVIGWGHISEGVMSKNKFNKLIIVPEGATEMYVQWADNDADISLIEAKKIDSYSVNFEELTDFINTSLNPLNSLIPAYALCGEEFANSHEGYIIRLNENNTISPAVVADGGTAYKVATYRVKAGYKVKFSCCANFGNIFYYLYNSATGEIHSYEKSESGSSKQSLEKEMIIPIGVDRICLANINTYPECYFMSGVKGGSPLSGVSCYAIGDSITEYNDKADKNYIEILMEKTGVSIINLANSGAGFLNEKENNTHYFGQVLTANSASPDLVLVMGSGNDLKYVVNNLGTLDSKDLDSLYGQMYQTYNFVMAKYGGRSKLAFIAPVAWKNYPPNIEGNVMEQYVEAMRKFCRKYCIPFLDLYHEGGLDPSCPQHYRYFDSEGVHPNADGHKIISSAIYKFLLGVVGMEAE